VYLDVDHVATYLALPRTVERSSVGLVLLPLASSWMPCWTCKDRS